MCVVVCTFTDGCRMSAQQAVPAPMVAVPTGYVNPNFAAYGNPMANMGAPMVAVPTGYVNPNFANMMMSNTQYATPPSYVNPSYVNPNFLAQRTGVNPQMYATK